MSQEQSTVKRDILGYIFLPRMIPRFRALFGQGFAYIPFFIALVYRCVRLLPANHPYLIPANMGRYGIRNVIAEAANNLVLDKRNIDQILMFVLIIIGMLIMVIQLGLFALGMFIQTGYAFPTNFEEFFVTAAPEQDIAFILLDMVFGIPEFFMSCVDPASGAICRNSADNDILISTDHPTLGGQPYTQFAAWPWPIHEGLHQMFAMFSYGILVVAVIITVYFMLTVVAESAQSGTAFGRRFNKVWAPVRIVVAFGLLVPLVYGLNSGQYIVLYAAKYGSGFATNGWIYFNTFLTDHMHEGMEELVATPKHPEAAALLQFFHVQAICRYMYEEVDNINVEMYLVREPSVAPLAAAGTSYDAMLTYIENHTRVHVRFGVEDNVNYLTYKSHVKPFCGEITLELTDPRDAADAEDGAETMQRFYWELIQDLYNQHGHVNAVSQDYHERIGALHSSEIDDDTVSGIPDPDADWRETQIDELNTRIDTAVGNAATALLASTRWNMEAFLETRGWAGAAIWYNRIADMNGALTAAVFAMPMPSLYPSVSEYVATKKRQYDQEVGAAERFNPNLPDGRVITFADTSKDSEKASAFWEGYQYWNQGNNATSTYTTPTGNVFNDAIMAIFGTEGLYDMRDNDDVHPLAQLTAIGRSLIESAIRNMGYIALGGTAGALLETMGLAQGATAMTLSSYLVTITMITLTMGFVLFYVLPFLPFIYFFFAVGGWVKGIFEAMVGVPLWALAHIRIDGEGLAGNAAVSGYFLIFEIFLRPILIIFGFLASILIFSAMVETLDTTFDLVSANTGGFSMTTEKTAALKQIEFYRSLLDQFMFTVMYAVIVYLLGQSSFKLIDLIPNNILRWMGQSVTTFNDERADPAEGLMSRAKMGSQQAINTIGGSVKGIVSPK